jgi:hypothetical protein
MRISKELIIQSAYLEDAVKLVSIVHSTRGNLMNRMAHSGQMDQVDKRKTSQNVAKEKISGHWKGKKHPFHRGWPLKCIMLD